MLRRKGAECQFAVRQKLHSVPADKPKSRKNRTVPTTPAIFSCFLDRILYTLPSLGLCGPGLHF